MRSTLARSRDRITEALAEVGERLHAGRDRSRLVVLPVLVPEHGARDAEVVPGHVRRGELAEEEAGGDGAGEAARRDVVDVREGRLERLAVLLDERQLPERLALVLPGADDAADEVDVRPHDPRDARAEGAD